jgi:hypothetical protein
LVTVADTGTAFPTSKDAGGAWLTAIEITGVSDPLAFVPVIPHPAIAMETARRQIIGRCVAWRRLMKVTFLSESANKKCSGDPNGPRESEPHPLQYPRFIIGSCPFRTEHFLPDAS